MTLTCQRSDYYLRILENFQYPTNISRQVYDRQVALERIFQRGISVYGSIRVNNCSFNKRVFVKCTTDQWKTFSIIKAYHSMYHSDDNTDSFQFKLTVPEDKLSLLLSQKSKSSSLISSMTVLFAICYCVNGQEFWDNNYSKNYSLEILESPPEEANSDLNQSFATATILHDDVLRRQIAQDYDAVPNASRHSGNICGLKNLGGTCYMNSVLQSLSFTSLLTDYFLSNEYTKDINQKNILAPKGIIANEYLNLIYLLCSSQYSILIPAPFKQIISHLQHAYLENQQQDAHEFLILLLDYLHTDLKRTKIAEISDKNKQIENNVTDRIHNDSIIVDLFYGIYQSITTCLVCMCISQSFEPFVCLTLSIPQTNQCTLEDCLDQLNRDEFLTDDARWFCPQCQCLCNAKKRLEIYKLPKILIIQLKRFQINSQMEWIKNETLVLCPKDNLDLQHRCSSSSSSQQSLYTLYSVINHNGSLDDGHYTTFCRNLTTKQQQWYECDDEIIKYLHSDELHQNTKAYLLFYVVKQMPESMDM